MTRNDRPVGENDLTALVDNELDAERRALVEGWLTSHPDERRRVEADIAIKQQLQDALVPLADAGLPDRFRLDRRTDDIRRARFSGLGRMAALVALAAMAGVGGGIGGWVLRGARLPAAAAQSDVNLALAAYKVFVPEKLHPVEVTAQSRGHLGTWLGNRIGTKIAIPDLSAEGLSLIGGRLLPGTNGPAGMLMYQTKSGTRVTLFLEAGRGDESAFSFARNGKTGMLAWRSPTLSYVLTGPEDKNQLVRMAHGINAAST